MIYIVHGENLSKSRALILNQQKKLMVRYKQEFSIEDTTPTDLTNKIRSIDIFGEPQFFVVNISGAGRANLEEYINVITQTPPLTTLVILSEKKLTASNIFIKNAAALKAQILENESVVEGTSFDFVDAVMRKDRVNSYKLMHRELDKDKDPFELFALLMYGLRSLAQVKFESPSASGMNPYVRSKQKNLTGKYSGEGVKELFKAFYEMDLKAKVGEINPEVMLTLAVEKVLNSN
ncbi:hypothetical protein A3K01_03435 [candidate division WWE3 bacterium RIFOXYD1_FULL_43_17]|uniref:DNA-directed DNA polymerase n=3 Tax=Katanobacteria TaxID=422282 RepID=A0A1F4XBV7_UNCKA|nr:MAG: hypothetical protein UU59_C0016G0007 [candidate division WWE3 bacterium GW2011_GWE1_41_27]KKS60234.1 MAG: hypothetical protein UV26_C0006G0031 [candidate division WWE3 bacterium GW2011_GWF2_42_42]OGC79129.1 MAG: hypothetical protein A3K01_03435 [candidate division WWE3 bacterium RIFOXYD1_FULL_43_17]